MLARLQWPCRYPQVGIPQKPNRYNLNALLKSVRLRTQYLFTITYYFFTAALAPHLLRVEVIAAEVYPYLRALAGS